MTPEQLRMLESLKAMQPGEALFRPSSIDRVVGCVGSVHLSRRVAKPKKSTEPQREGTACHKLIEMAWNGEIATPHDMVGRLLAISDTEDPVFVDEEMADGATMMLDHVQSIVDSADNASNPDNLQIFNEHFMSLKPLNPDDLLLDENRGTADFIVLDYTNRVLYVVDAKYGKGKMVSPETPQLKDYALMAAVNFSPPESGWARIETHIVQPRAYGDDISKKIKTHAFGFDELMEYVGEIYPRFLAALEPAQQLTKGPWCFWCPAARGAICPEMAREALSDATAAFEKAPPLTAQDVIVVPPQAPVFPDPRTLTPEQIAFILDRREFAEGFFTACEKTAVDMMESGVKIPGFGLKPRTGHRRWVDPQEAAKVLQSADGGGLQAREVWTEPKVATPAVIEKLLPASKKHLCRPGGENPLVVVPDNGYALVRAEKATLEAVPSLGPIEHASV